MTRLLDRLNMAKETEREADQVQRANVWTSENFAVVSCLFNPAGFKRREVIARTFFALCDSQQLRVSLATAGGPDYAADVSGEWTVRAVMLPHHCMWQKERLLCAAVEQLPPEIEYVAWVDADVIHANPCWVSDTIEALQTVDVVQTFHRAVWFDAIGNRERVLESAAAASGGHPGFSWAARREWIAAGGIYDRGVLGAGDLIMARAMGMDVPGGIFPEHHLKFIQAYTRKIAGTKYGFVPGEILHPYHGRHADRGYGRRWEAEARYQFDPIRHVERDGILWRWSDDAPDGLIDYMAGYFASRKEDRDT